VTESARPVAPGGRLILRGYGSPRSGVPTDPVKREVRAHGFEPELEREIEAPDGDGSILELAVLRAASQGDWTPYDPARWSCASDPGQFAT
jgi:hypothetical protein